MCMSPLSFIFSLSLSLTRIEIYSFEDKNKENVIEHSAGMKSTRDEVDVQSKNFERHLNLLHAVHTQMQAWHRLVL